MAISMSSQTAIPESMMSTTSAGAGLNNEIANISGSSPITAPTSGSDTSSTKTLEEELFCQEIQRRLLEAEFRKPAGGDLRFASGILRGPRVIAER
jgi:hypothetical protein